MRVKRHRIIAALGLTTIMVVGQLTGLLHLASTPHVECVEHGELIHVPVITAAAQPHSTIHHDADLPEHLRRHEHCQAMSVRRTPLLQALRRLSAAEQPCISYAQLQLSIDQTLAPSIAILRQAPKGSPPPRSS